MSSKRLTLIVALFMIASMVLTACGGEAATNTAVVAPTNTTAPVVPTDTAAPAPTDTVMVAPTDTAAPVATDTAAPVATNTVVATTMITAAASTTDKLYSAADCAYGGVIKSIEAVDDSTVKFTMCKPDPAFPSKAAFASLGIQSEKHLTETGGGTPALLEHPLGTGPYMLSEWVRGDHMTFVPNPNYWGDAPVNKSLIFKWNSEAAARLNSLKAGEADGIDNPDPNDFESIKGEKDLNLIPREALNTFYLGMNNAKPPFDNEKVRQAIAMGINRQTIVDKFYPAGSTVADYFTPCAIPGGCEGDKWYAQDLATAKQMITDAGAAGANVKLSYRDVVRGYLPAPGKVAEELQAQLKELGINATIDVQESGTFLDNASKGNLEIFLLGWGADYPDQTDFLDYHFGAGANDTFGKKFDDITSVLSKAASLADQAARNKLYADANNLIKQHVPMIPVAHGGSAVVYKATVQNAHTGPLGNETFRIMSVPGSDQFVWAQNAEPLSLYCADESDGETLRACQQVFDPLLNYKVGGVEVVPGLAETYDVNTDLTEYTFHIRKNAKFSDGTAVTASDVVMTYAVQWDKGNKLHVGNTGNFDYWGGLFGAFLNDPGS